MAPRWSGGARGTTLRTTPKNAGPNPRPPTTLPKNRPGSESKATAASVIPTPARRTSEPRISRSRGCGRPDEGRRQGCGPQQRRNDEASDDAAVGPEQQDGERRGSRVRARVLG